MGRPSHVRRRPTVARALALLGLLGVAVLAAAFATRTDDGRERPSAAPDAPSAAARAHPPVVLAVGSGPDVAAVAGVESAAPSPPSPGPPAPRETTAASREEPDGAERRPVRGVVREAGTGRPIRGAWVSVAAIRPEDARCLFASAEAVAHARDRLTDEDGRFALARGSGAAREVYAAAPGHAIGSAFAGPGDEVVIELAPMGILEAHLRGALDPPPRLSLVTAAEPGDEHLVETLVVAPLWRVEHLAAGRYVLHADGVAPIPVIIEAGAATVVAVDVPACVPLRGTLLGADGAPAAGWTLFLTPDLMQPLDWLAGHESTSTTTDAAGRFSTQARPGRVRVVGGAPRDAAHGERDLSLGVIEPGPEVTLRLPATVPFTLLQDPARARRGALMAVRGDAFIELEGDRPELAGRVPPGPWLLLLEGGLSRMVVVPAAGLRMAADDDQVDLTLRWRLPAGQGPGARVQAHVSLLPPAIPRGGVRSLLADADDFGLDVAVSADLRTTLRVLPGPVVIGVRSELGRVELPVEVAARGATEVEVVLGP